MPKRRNTTRADHFISRTTGRVSADKDIHGAGHRHRQHLCLAQRQGFRHQLAQQHVEVGNQSKRNRHRQQVGVDLGMRHAGKPVLEQGGDRRLADPAQGQAAQGDPQLHRRQKVFHVFLQAAHCPRSRPPQGNQPFDAGLAHAHHGKFGGHKEAVRQDEQGDGNHPKEHQFNHFARKPGITS